MNTKEFIALKQACPMPVLLKKLGLQSHARGSCKSSLRDDTKASWGIFQRDGGWFFKDHATGQSSDEIKFLGLYLDLNPKTQFQEILREYQRVSSIHVDIAPSNVMPELAIKNQRLDVLWLAMEHPITLKRLLP